jgi:hypothetical protein
VPLPRISVHCDCGRAGAVPYGETWQCEGCGRRFDTRQVPEEHVASIARELRRYRALAVGVAVAVAAVVVPLAVLVSERFFFLLLLLLGGWAFLALPVLRRRAHARLRDLPSWSLRPE